MSAPTASSAAPPTSADTLEPQAASQEAQKREAEVLSMLHTESPLDHDTVLRLTEPVQVTGGGQAMGSPVSFIQRARSLRALGRVEEALATLEVLCRSLDAWVQADPATRVNEELLRQDMVVVNDYVAYALLLGKVDAASAMIDARIRQHPLRDRLSPDSAHRVLDESAANWDARVADTRKAKAAYDRCMASNPTRPHLSAEDGAALMKENGWSTDAGALALTWETAQALLEHIKLSGGFAVGGSTETGFVPIAWDPATQQLYEPITGRAAEVLPPMGGKDGGDGAAAGKQAAGEASKEAQAPYV